jgi:predicted TIM-barrel fold metal-dependent hydrolase
VDISATANLLAGGPFAEQFVWVLRNFGIDRVIYRSDYPVGDLEAAKSLGFSDAELAAVLHDNAAALLAPAPGP